MVFDSDNMDEKLTLLFIMDKMEIPLTKNNILDIITRNQWLNYMECIDVLNQLLDTNFIYKIDENGNVNEDDTKYSITYSGRECLSHFYTRIKLSIREEITNFAKENGLSFKRSQEYLSEYDKNEDGSYKVTLKIKEPLINVPLLEINLKAPNKSSAMAACTKWNEKAPNIFEYLYDTIIDN
ncbi:MAG: DUF4364 family protein [Clostridiales bacterium]|nr:DUF4364 family protein [Clostridiales bacterium]